MKIFEKSEILDISNLPFSVARGPMLVTLIKGDASIKYKDFDESDEHQYIEKALNGSILIEKGEEVFISPVGETVIKYFYKEIE